MRDKRNTWSLEQALAIQQMRNEGATWTQIRMALDVSTPVAKHLLEKFGLKVTVKRAGNWGSDQERWDRPCIVCGARERRPKGLFRCRPCIRAMENEYDPTVSLGS